MNLKHEEIDELADELDAGAVLAKIQKAHQIQFQFIGENVVVETPKGQKAFPTSDLKSLAQNVMGML